MEEIKTHHSTSIVKLSEAMALVQGELESAKKNAQNPHFRNDYANLESVIDAIRIPLSKHGLWFRQVTHERDKPGAAVETIIHHQSGEWMSCGVVFVPATKVDAHGMGSALTYARRYSLATALGVAQADDDGNKAIEKETTKLQPQRKGDF